MRATIFSDTPQSLSYTAVSRMLLSIKKVSFILQVILRFVFTGYADCIRCFFCGVGLKSWDASDDVLTEHIRWRPNCGFLLTTKGRRFVQNTLNRLVSGGRTPPSAAFLSVPPLPFCCCFCCCRCCYYIFLLLLMLSFSLSIFCF